MMKILQPEFPLMTLKWQFLMANYPNDYPYPSCLLIGKNFNGQFFHVVIGLGEDELWLITAYKPSAEKWEDDFKTRKEEKI